MSGRVIQALRASSLVAVVSEAELRSLSSCGRVYEYSPQQVIFGETGQDERLFVLREGKVALQLTMQVAGGQCNGTARFTLAEPGEPFGWATWVRPDRIEASAQAVGPVSLVALDLSLLHDSQTLWKVSQATLLKLYAWLQAGGICPPDVEGLLRLKQMRQGVPG
jgi:CRP-like cAMP-binding protein